MALRFVLVLYTCLSWCSVSANGALTAWIERDNKEFSIKIAAFHDHEWRQLQTPIISGESAITTPVVILDSNRRLVAFWAEQSKTGVHLKTMRSKDQFDLALQSIPEWGAVSLIPSSNQYNVAPSAVLDREGKIWLFWSSGGISPSDVFYKVYHQDSWGKTKRVHDKNNVPDNSALANLTESGNVAVTWQSFDQELLAMMPMRREFSEDMASIADVEINRIEKGSYKNPIFIPQGQRVVVHVPQSRIGQNTLLQGLFINE